MGKARSDVTADDRMSQLKGGIESSRAEMDQTLGALGQKLDPDKLKAQAEKQIEAVKDVAKEQLEAAKAMAREELLSMKETLKHEVQDSYREAREAVREATIGRVENMVHRASDTITDTSTGILDTIKANPIPAAMAGIGLLWLFSSAKKQRRSNERIGVSYRGEIGGGYGGRDYGYDYERSYGDRHVRDDRHGMMERVGQGAAHLRDRVGETAAQARDAVGHVAHQARDAVGNVAHQAGDAVGHAAHAAGDTVGHLAHDAGDALHAVTDRARHLAHDAEDGAMALARRTRDQAVRMEGQLEETYRDNPLAIGAVALALGAAVGLALPRTDRENALMGEARDRLVQKARGFAHDSIEKAQQVATKVGEEAGRVAKSEAKMEGLIG